MPNFWRQWRRRVRGLARRSWSNRSLALESVAMLAAARLLVVTGREKNLVSRLGGAEPVREPELTSGGSTEGVAWQIGSMVERVAPHTWWRSMCLEKALAGKWMLRRRGIPSTMYVGMAKEGDRFIAHAWLVGEGRTLTGAATKVYATLAAFREQ